MMAYEVYFKNKDVDNSLKRLLKVGNSFLGIPF
jgi:hypothetical protein